MARAALLVSIAVALIAAAPAGAQTTAPQRSIAVTGSGTVTAPNDTAHLDFGVRTAHKTPAAALNDTSKRTQRVIDALTGLGIAKADIQTQTVSLQRSVRPKRKHHKRKVVYVASNSLNVTVRDISKTGAAIAAAVNAGATGLAGVDFTASNSEGLYRQALGLAYDDAHAKAEALAEKAGVTLGRPLTIEEGQQDFGEPATGLVSAPLSAAPPPIEPGTASVQALVTVVFAIS